MKENKKQAWLYGVVVNGYHDSCLKCVENYKVPSKKDYEELIHSTKYSFDCINHEGVFTFPDGEQFYLPANGALYEDGIVYGNNTEGIYITPTCVGNKRWLLHFTQKKVTMKKVVFACYASLFCIPK